MNTPDTSFSGAAADEEAGAFWDTHDLADHWEQTTAAQFTVELASVTHQYSVDPALSDKLRTLAHARGISPETLLNLWVQEKTAAL